MAVRNKTKKKTEKEKEVKEGTNGESDAANQIALPTAHRSDGRSVGRSVGGALYFGGRTRETLLQKRQRVINQMVLDRRLHGFRHTHTRRRRPVCTTSTALDEYLLKNECRK